MLLGGRHVGRLARGAGWGAAVGVALGVVLVVGAFAYEAYRTRDLVDDPTKVVIVFAIVGEDGGSIAHTAAIVRPGVSATASVGASYYVADTSSTVSLPGLSDTRLASVYAFDGAAGVAAAHDGGDLRRGTGWVDVPPAAWVALLPEGVEVTLSDSFDTFDGERFVAFAAGSQRIRGVDLRAFANGIEYLPAPERRALRETVARASLSALASGAEAPKGTSTNLTPKGWARLVAAVRRD
jgi:hypothetical protein